MLISATFCYDILKLGHPMLRLLIFRSWCWDVYFEIQSRSATTSWSTSERTNVYTCCYWTSWLKWKRRALTIYNDGMLQTITSNTQPVFTTVLLFRKKEEELCFLIYLSSQSLLYCRVTVQLFILILILQTVICFSYSHMIPINLIVGGWSSISKKTDAQSCSRFPAKEKHWFWTQRLQMGLEASFVIQPWIKNLLQRQLLCLVKGRSWIWWLLQI